MLKPSVATLFQSAVAAGVIFRLSQTPVPILDK